MKLFERFPSDYRKNRIKVITKTSHIHSKDKIITIRANNGVNQSEHDGKTCGWCLARENAGFTSDWLKNQYTSFDWIKQYTIITVLRKTNVRQLDTCSRRQR